MGFQTTTIRYGWVALASLAVSFGAVTIYVLNNQRHQIKPQDIIELAVGVDERCMGIQTADGSYPVARPSFVRTWTSNVYTTNGVTIYTNIVTNTIGWHVDRDMMISLDTTISNLVPHYKNTNDNYNSLTWTGLFASLGIGDHTGRFTRTPCWTNPVQTNYHVCYTSYWPTNGVYFPTTNNYTTTVYHAINVATNWDGTNLTWVAMSNWASTVVTVTNVATYGDYPWQIYVEDLQERYKILNALQWASNSYMWCSNQVVYLWHQQEDAAVSLISTGLTSRSCVEAIGEDDDASVWLDTIIPWVESAAGSDPHALENNLRNQTYGRYEYSGSWIAGQWQDSARYIVKVFATNRPHTVLVEARAVAPSYIVGFWTLPSPTNAQFANSPFGSEDEWVPIINVVNGYSSQEVSAVYGTLSKDWVNNPYVAGGTNVLFKGYDTETRFSAWYGDPSGWVLNGTTETNTAFETNRFFYYCTNKYW